MSILYSHLSFRFLYIVCVLFLTNCVAIAQTTPKNPNARAEIIGTWVYHVEVCNGKKATQANFEIRIEEDYLITYSNILNCNSCDKNCVITDSTIVFPDKNSTEACTLLECGNNSYKFCKNKNILNYFFQDMNYQVLGNELVLEANGKTVKLKRK